MKVNSNHIVYGKTVVLVPYKTHHVDTYHKWMMDPFLLEMTASEPLSIEEEHEMQQSWAVDETKLTFIVLSKDMDGKLNGSPAAEAALGGMIGDVNLYFTDFEDPIGKPEIEVMIAEPSMRRKGAGLEALQLIMQYAMQNVPGIHTFVSKISLKNEPSRTLFTQKLGYKEVKIVEAFEEVTLERAVSAAEFHGKLEIQEYNQIIKE
ncbi:N-acetyltransferase 9-like protein [Rhizoclosmatium globosum]|uniref:N-acetyltransferase 9-like protein n=1 Tax=Rhizoclosmatium globosum TaxID=329046 RepID=A0A1Y2CNC4_9FUNG|nr:N-acetyltransferase 9-like protein [Rhizoclosmatium globosum]|eukprot:ORY48502.1 N-acetyltransferase 9-like protein [Rhizoclosmatium globosum]